VVLRALLGSQFRPRTQGDQLGEGWTHADGVVGHFSFRGRRGDVVLDEDARQLVVIEAKLFSGLSTGTSRAKSFDQAARNVACIAQLLVDHDLTRLERLGFIVLAPAEQIANTDLGKLCDRTSVELKVQDRVASYSGAKDSWYRSSFLPALGRVDIRVISWEQVLSDISMRDEGAGEELSAFYARCVAFNRPWQTRVVRSNTPAA
jgi:hypothetical protein